MVRRNQFIRRVPGKRGLVLLAGILCLLTSGFANALGLGQATVNSYLNEPLSARIDLISRSEAEMATVTAGMASPADFQVIGLTRDAIGIPIDFTVSRDLADPHIRLTSTQVMREPVLQLVVEVVWSSGRMLRQYTLFFDPPSFAAPAPLPAMPRSASPGSSGAAQEPAPEAAAPVEQSAPALSAVESPVEETTPVSAATEAGPPFDPVLVPTVEESGTAAPGPEAVTAEEAVVADAVEPASGDPALEPVADGTANPEPVVLEDTPDEGPDELALTEQDAPVTAAETESPAAEDASNADVASAEPAVPEDGATLDEVALAAGDADAASAEAETVLPEPEAEQGEEQEPATEQEQVAAADDTETGTRVEEAPAEPVYRAVVPDSGAQQGSGVPEVINVVRGDTLWDLSRDIATARGVTVNQVMLAVQQSNPQAFLDNNINRMMAGEVLRIPERDDMLAMNARDAMLEVLRQETLYGTRWNVPGDPNNIPMISDLAQEVAPGDGGARAEDTAPAATAPEDMSLVLVPPSARDESMAEGMAQGTGGTNEVSEGMDVVEELARTQEELANARQENNYLAERISELESALEEQQTDDGQGIADSNLADMEDRLRDERLAGEPEPELDVTPEPPPGWLSRFGPWLGLAFILLVGAVVIFLRSRRSGDAPTAASLVAAQAGIGPAAGLISGMSAAPDVDAEAAEMSLADPEARLDLARAYAAMGRNDKARELLETVVMNGNPIQEREAREMLSEL